MFEGMSRKSKPLQTNGSRYVDRQAKSDRAWALAYRELLPNGTNPEEVPNMIVLSAFDFTRAVLSTDINAVMSGGPASRRDHGDRSYASTLTGNAAHVTHCRQLNR